MSKLGGAAPDMQQVPRPRPDGVRNTTSNNFIQVFRLIQSLNVLPDGTVGEMKYTLLPLKIMVFSLVIIFTNQAFAVGYHTSKILIEVHDLKAERNPVKSIRADTWKAIEVEGKIKPKKGQAVSVVCEGKFPLGMIANDLFGFDGKFNREFKITDATTLVDICNQQENAMRIRNPKLFK